PPLKLDHLRRLTDENGMLQHAVFTIHNYREWIFCPEESYERQGDVGNVVFPCGYTVAPDGDTLHLYYGAADSSIGLATGSVGAMLEWLE
ncbi:MAG: hypothetical protein JW913_05380, partial [Chitinispirillaceae bacterium]|nr:hypothetical protein [Chitinispirillaceae bacterium]